VLFCSSRKNFRTFSYSKQFERLPKKEVVTNFKFEAKRLPGFW